MKRMVSARIDAELVGQVDTLAAELGISRQRLIEKVCAEVVRPRCPVKGCDQHGQSLAAVCPHHGRHFVRGANLRVD